MITLYLVNSKTVFISKNGDHWKGVRINDSHTILLERLSDNLTKLFNEIGKCIGECCGSYDIVEVLRKPTKFKPGAYRTKNSARAVILENVVERYKDTGLFQEIEKPLIGYAVVLGQVIPAAWTLNGRYIDDNMNSSLDLVGNIEDET